MQQPSKKKRLIVLVISGIIALSASLILYYSPKDPNLNIEITELVAKYNENCPLLIQPGIRLDSVSLPKKQVVQYNLTLVNVEKETAEIGTIKENIEQSLISTAKANPGIKTFRDNNFTLIYHYSDVKKVYLFEVTIVPDQYK
ncbi:hypothetical protein IRZ71_13455 [Flavobacterium sp. ANB]|uniref:hypothetical protein n=1 Tax=unclassified Flavobacterium TaxID=196869 RepID=UPI0012B6D6BA|nr:MULTISPECIES: hypothetical protein [unclassified Flavobacterium]MBF4517364.1 hypothetical protein [Flavobacterium sp. ANB]MTD70740.1 hypothetical protein [Flavobacterium sp. LC2016-13]